MNQIADENNFRDRQFSVPWQYAPSGSEQQRDSDGFPLSAGSSKEATPIDRQTLHAHIWGKFHSNPHVNTSTRGLVGRICGNGFATASDITEIDDAIDETETDYRNRLYDYWPKFVTRGFIGGELHLCFTCHDDGFVEVDFIDPDVIEGEPEHGIIFHPRKTRMPLVYCIKDTDNDIEEHIPSIYLARYPELYRVAKAQDGFSAKMLDPSRTRKRSFRSVGGFYRFIVSWDLGLITKRSTSHLQTILQWLNHWETLKMYEIDHKKSSGSYVWVVKFTDVKSWITWLNLTDEERAKTGIAAAKTPGGTLVIGPNMEVEAKMPQLPKISGGDSDVMQMISSGLNEAQDVTTGESKGTFASVKASRGPMSDRISDEMVYFERWLRYDFWGNIFFLKGEIAEFPKTFDVEEAVDFDKNQEPVFKVRKKKPERCLDITFPISEIENTEGQAKALLGVKHGSLNDTAGIPNEVLMRKMGFRGYKRLRLQKATEDKKYPKTILAVDQEQHQELTEAEPSKTKKQSPKPKPQKKGSG
ncbi:MAG: hypothetical protein C4576_11390 [Desulfobacteraceae bacterium]|nr:MAG: hypothetical protein C4576_11390 [Desulfobacteraceae bacterium]